MNVEHVDNRRERVMSGTPARVWYVGCVVVAVHQQRVAPGGNDSGLGRHQVVRGVGVEECQRNGSLSQPVSIRPKEGTAAQYRRAETVREREAKVRA